MCATPSVRRARVISAATPSAARVAITRAWAEGSVIAISMRSRVETDLEPAGSEQATTRPAVSVIVPFAGSTTEAEKAVAALQRLRLRPGDQVIVADNSPGDPRPDGVAEWVGAPDL